jgi:hypothetical protein
MDIRLTYIMTAAGDSIASNDSGPLQGAVAAPGLVASKSGYPQDCVDHERLGLHYVEERTDRVR